MEAAPALYHDGVTARSRPVSIRIDENLLVIADVNGTVLDRWPLDQVHAVGEPGSGEAPRLRSGFDRDARLTLASAADFARLAANFPKLTRSNPGWKHHWRPILLWGGGAILSVVLIVTVVIPVAAPLIAQHMPASWEARIGDEAATQINRVLASGRPACRSSEGMKSLDTVIARLTEGSEGPGISVRVLDARPINAFALPGGHIILFRGLIADAKSPDEIAGVLAHEIGHVMRRHPVETAVKGSAASILIGLLLGDIAGGTIMGGIGQVMAGAAYSREAEREADSIALDLLNRANIRADGVVAFFERVAPKQGVQERDIAIISSHPMSADRATLFRSQGTGRGAALTDAEWQALRQICPQATSR
jgi:Zn-dependent protease with chaperone function